MTTRADKFLEGFKLGKLGAGHRPFVNVPDEKEEPQSIATGELKILADKRYKDSSGNTRSYLFWQDPDGWKYLLEIVRHKSDQVLYTMILSGGPKMSIVTMKDHEGVGRHKQEWSARFKDPLLIGDIKSIYRRYRQFILRKGIQPLLSNSIYYFKATAMTDDSVAFGDWLKSKGIKDA
jgi:hypothetical protein